MEGLVKRHKYVKKIFEISKYPTPIRKQILLEMSMIDILMAVEVDVKLSKWMRETFFWDEIWKVKVIPLMIEKGIAKTFEEAEQMRLGDSGRKNCVVWFFVCKPTTLEYYISAVKLLDKSGNSATIIRYDNMSTRSKYFRITVKNPRHLKTLLPDLEWDEDEPWILKWYITNDETEYKRAQIFHALLTLGFYFTVTMRESKEKFYINEHV